MKRGEFENLCDDLYQVGEGAGIEYGRQEQWDPRDVEERKRITVALLAAFDAMWAELARLTAIRQLAAMVIQSSNEGYQLIGHSRFHGVLLTACRFDGKLKDEILPEAMVSRVALADALADAVGSYTPKGAGLSLEFCHGVPGECEDETCPEAGLCKAFAAFRAEEEPHRVENPPLNLGDPPKLKN